MPPHLPPERHDARLIVTADDFGISPGVNRGVVESHRQGLTTSASLMSNLPCAGDAVARWRDCPGLGLGLHLTLTTGRPVCQPDRVPTLVGPDGAFHPLSAWLPRAATRRLAPDDLRREIDAQIERALQMGAGLDHLDSHHHVHALPLVGRHALAAARRYGVGAIRAPVEAPRAAAPGDLARALVVSAAARWLRGAAREAGLYTSPGFAGLSLGYGFGPERLARHLETLPDGVTELMVHPGHPDDELARLTGYVAGRERELAALVSPQSRAAVRAGGARLATWADAQSTARTRRGPHPADRSW